MFPSVSVRNGSRPGAFPAPVSSCTRIPGGFAWIRALGTSVPLQTRWICLFSSGRELLFQEERSFSPSQPFYPPDGFNSFNSTNYRGQQERDSQSCAVSACLLSVVMAKFWLKGHLNLLGRWEEYFFWDYPCVKRCSLFRIPIKNNNNMDRRAAGAFSSEISPSSSSFGATRAPKRERDQRTPGNQPIHFCSPA